MWDRLRVRENREPSPPHFVELPPPRTPDRSTGPETLELTRPNGSRLILRLPTVRARDLLPLVHAFLRS